MTIECKIQINSTKHLNENHFKIKERNSLHVVSLYISCSSYFNSVYQQRTVRYHINHIFHFSEYSQPTKKRTIVKTP